MKNIVIIPILAENEEDLAVPLGKLEDVTLLETTYNQAKQTKVSNVVVTSNSLHIGQFCSTNGIPFFPSSRDCPSGTHRCAEIAAKFKPDAKVSNVICWPVCYPLIASFDVNEMIDLFCDNGVVTLASRVSPHNREAFNQDSSLVKVRAFGGPVVDFSRCPLPLALCHIGIYMYSLHELLKIGQIAPTKLSLEEGLEQLSWTQYEHKTHISLVRTNHLAFPIAVRTEAQLEAANIYLQRERQEQEQTV